jgi:hypothetical protein
MMEMKGMAMFTKESRPIRVYKVVFEHIPTGIYSTLYVENVSAFEAGQSVMAQLGKEYDLIMSTYTTKNDLN